MLGFLGSGIYYGALSILLQNYTPVIASIWLMHLVLFAFAVLILVSLTMGGLGLK
jgi:hypothetical protein